MTVDLLAGARHIRHTLEMSSAYDALRTPTILVFDSGVGGLTVQAALAVARPDACCIYLADDAMFPYGALEPDRLVSRVVSVLGHAIARWSPDLIVIACNTASTLVLPALRARFTIPVVGTVPAVKPAALLSRTGRISVLATPGTVARDYTRDLIATYAGACQVTLVGATRLAALAEAQLAGDTISDDVIAAEIAPCFTGDPDDPAARTDVVALACTHYPLLLPAFARLAPWPVAWIDPAPAIARRAAQLLSEPCRDAVSAFTPGTEGVAAFTSGRNLPPRLEAALVARGLRWTAFDAPGV